VSASLRTIRALVRRAFNEILRVPAGAISGVLAPTLFMVGISGVFGAAAHLQGFPTTSFRSFVVPVGFVQAATFAGAATGVNLARDIEQGWFDRLIVCPAPRATLLTGLVTSAALRSLLPTTTLVAIAFALGVHWPGIDGLAIAYALEMMLAAAVACWGISMALRFRTQQAAPLIQMAGLLLTLFSTAYAPKELLSPWLRHIADFNPAVFVMEGIRQGFVSGVNWGDSWQAAVAAIALLLVLGAIAIRGMSRVGVRV
jgi:ABC-type multidrug transport system permease subunit